MTLVQNAVVFGIAIALVAVGVFALVMESRQ